MTQKQLFTLPIGPGVYTEQSERGAAGRWFQADKVRFRRGLAEKIGGWVRIQPAFLGICRRLYDWSSLDAQQWAAVATEKKLYIWQRNALFDITPLRKKGKLTNPFDTVLLSSTVTVNHINHGGSVGDSVHFRNATAGGGLTIDGEYNIVSSLTNSYTIVDDQVATATVIGSGGSVDYEYEISIGKSTSTVATGYGVGLYGKGPYGKARTGSTLIAPLRTWALDTWGEDLLASPRSGKIYWWDRSKGTGVRAQALGGEAPPNNEYMIVSQRDRHVLALGAYDFFNKAFDPLLIRWSSTEDLNDWVPTSTNTSGDLRLYSGSRIITAVRSRLETVIWTDVSVHTLPFVGGFDVFGLNTVGENVTILGPNGAIAIDHRVFFMAEADFYVYDGLLKVLPCAVRNHIYDNLNVDQKGKVAAGLNREFNEIWWFYPSYDPAAWRQQDFTLKFPKTYSIANSSSASDPLFAQVQLLAKFEGSDAATAYTEVSNNAAIVSFLNQAQIDIAQKNFGASSLLLDGVGDVTTLPAISAYNLLSGDFTIECFIHLNALLVNPETRGVTGQAGAGGNSFSMSLVADAFSTQRVQIMSDGVTETSTIINTTLATGVWYHFCIERIGNNFYCGFNGFREFLSIGHFFGAVQNSTELLHIGGVNGTTNTFNGHIDDVRITVGSSRYDLLNNATYTVPSSDFLAGPVAQSVGYAYQLNSAGYTEVVATANNNYEHDFFLTNSDPILDPLNAEYAVELDVNPLGGGTANAGLSFFRTDLVGVPATGADDASQWMVELDVANDLLRITKKIPVTGAIAAPDNLGANTTGFLALTGAAITTGKKYIIKVQVKTPTITVWVDDNQAFQFNLSAQELIDYTSGTAGLHMAPGAANTNKFRFYNFAAGPIGVITATTFDISPIEVNRYAAYNYEEGTWTTGCLSRTAWADRSPLLDKPYAASTDGFLYQHETGTDDNATAMAASIESFDMEIPPAGEQQMHVDQLIPDFLTLEGSVDVHLTGRKYPQSGVRISKGPFAVVNTTTKISTRIRARQVALRVESNTLGDKWRMGNWRGRAGTHGKRS